MNIHAFWNAVLQQNAASMRIFFHPDAVIRWHNTNEQFTVEEFIQANCEYPNSWEGEIEQLIRTNTHIITAVHVFTTDKSLHFHVTSFIRIEDDKILSLDEYWGDDGPIPQWRQDMHIGTTIYKAH